MGVAKLKKSVIDIADEQIEAKKASAKFVTVKIFFTIRPHLQPCHCEVMSLPTQARVSEVQDIAWNVLTAYREKVGPLIGPLPSEDPRDYMLCFFDRLSATSGSAGPMQTLRQQTVTSQIQSSLKQRHCSAPRAMSVTMGPSNAGDQATDGGAKRNAAAASTHALNRSSTVAMNLSLEIPSDNDEPNGDGDGVDEEAIGLKDLLCMDTARSSNQAMQSAQPPPTKGLLQSNPGTNAGPAGSGFGSSRRRSSAGGDDHLRQTVLLATADPNCNSHKQLQGASPLQTPETGNLSARFSASPGVFHFGTAISEVGDLGNADDANEDSDRELVGVLGDRIREAEAVCRRQQQLACQTASIEMCEEAPPSAVVLRVVTNRQQQLEAFKANGGVADNVNTKNGRIASADHANSKKRESTPQQRRLSVSLGLDGGGLSPVKTPTRRASRSSNESPSNRNLELTAAATPNVKKMVHGDDEREVYDDAVPSLHLMLKPVFFLLEQTVGNETQTRQVIDELFTRSLQGIFRFAAHCAEIAAKTTEKRILDAAERQQMEKREYAVRKKIVRLEDATWHESLATFKARFKELEVGMIAQYRLITTLRERHLKEVERMIKERHGGVNPYAEEIPPPLSSSS